jgi:DNA polymerase III alpha subunit
MDPQKETKELISDAKNFNITVYPPTLKEMFNGNPGRFSMKKDSIFFGIGDIKKIGESHVNRIFENVNALEQSLGRTIDKWTWYDFLVFFSDSISQTAVNGLIAAGATDYMGGSRNGKIHEYNEWRKLTIKERNWIKNNCDPNNRLIIAVEYLQNNYKIISSRVSKIEDIHKSLQNPSFSLQDDAYYIARHEHELLGIPITCSKLDTCTTNLEASATCKEFLDGKGGKISLKVEIIGINEYIITRGKMKGQKMLFLQVEDDTGVVESVVIFPSTIAGNEPHLIPGSTVLLEGKRDTSKYKDSFIVDKITPI